jgi:diadenosine tetraphosphatase ApaH/serine/threonine PP2A family protein phosphatase
MIAATAGRRAERTLSNPLRDHAVVDEFPAAWRRGRRCCDQSPERHPADQSTAGGRLLFRSGKRLSARTVRPHAAAYLDPARSRPTPISCCATNRRSARLINRGPGGCARNFPGWFGKTARPRYSPRNSMSEALEIGHRAVELKRPAANRRGDGARTGRVLAKLRWSGSQHVLGSFGASERPRHP